MNVRERQTECEGDMRVVLAPRRLVLAPRRLVLIQLGAPGSTGR